MPTHRLSTLPENPLRVLDFNPTSIGDKGRTTIVFFSLFSSSSLLPFFLGFFLLFSFFLFLLGRPSPLYLLLSSTMLILRLSSSFSLPILSFSLSSPLFFSFFLSFLPSKAWPPPHLAQEASSL